MSEFHSAIDTIIPLRTVRKHPTDCPWRTNKIKRWIYYSIDDIFSKWQRINIYKFWRNEEKREIKVAIKHYCHNSVEVVRAVRKLTGQDQQHEKMMSSIFLKVPGIPNFNHSPLLSHQEKIHAVKLLVTKEARQSLSSINITEIVGI